jgi:hypothetical protein
MLAKVETMLAQARRDVFCLGTTATGYPRHPSRLGYDAQMRPWRNTQRAAA